MPPVGEMIGQMITIWCRTEYPVYFSASASLEWASVHTVHRKQSWPEQAEVVCEFVDSPGYSAFQRHRSGCTWVVDELANLNCSAIAVFDVYVDISMTYLPRVLDYDDPDNTDDNPVASACANTDNVLWFQHPVSLL